MVDNDIKVGNMANENLIEKDIKAEARKEAAAKRSLRKKKKNHLKLQKKHPILSILVYLVTAFLICTFIFLVIFIFIGHFFDDRVTTENETVNYMARQYNSAIASGSEEVYQYIDAYEREYIIVDNNNNVIREVGNNTCDLTKSGYYSGVLSNNIDIIIYPNMNNNIVMFHNEGSAYINMFRYWNTVNNPEIYVTADKFDEDSLENELGIEISDDGWISAPFWISTELKDGKILLLTDRELFNKRQKEVPSCPSA